LHELSLAQALIDQVKLLLKEHNANKVLRISVEIGPFSGIVIDSFEFGYYALIKEEPSFIDSKLEIITPPALYQCVFCGRKFKEDELTKDKRCPFCKDSFLTPVGDGDILLKEVEME